MTDVPKGVTAVLIDPQGRVAADATDFNAGGSAGLSQQEAQTRRAKKAVAVGYVDGCCNGYLSRVIRDGYPGADGIMSKLISDHGFRLHIIAHGYGEAE